MSNKFLSGFIKMMNFNDVDDEDNYDEDYYEDEPEETPQKKSYSKSSSRREYSSSKSRDYSDKETQASSPFEAARKERAAKYGNSPKVVPYSKNIKLSEVCIRKPTSQKDAESICDTLLSGSPVVVNFCGVERNDRQRIMDFVCGCIYSIDGNMEIIKKEEMYIFSPTGIELIGDISPDGENIPTFKDDF